MMKSAPIALALVFGAVMLAPQTASAIDKGPCDHCTMDPIVVKGERPKKNTAQGATGFKQTQSSNNPGQVRRAKRRSIRK